MSSPEKSSESVAYLPGASAIGSSPGLTPVAAAAQPPGVAETSSKAAADAHAGDPQARLAALEHLLAEISADRDDLRQQRDQLRDQVLELPEELAVITNSRAFRIMKAGPLLAMRQPLSTLLIVASMGMLTNLWTFTPIATSIYIGVGAVVLVVSALQFWASHD